MHRSRIPYLPALLAVLLILVCANSGFAQAPTISGIGLSSSISRLDSFSFFGDTLFAVISFEREPGFDVQGLALNIDEYDLVTVHYYASQAPEGDPLGSSVLSVPRSSISIDTVSTPNVLHFPLILQGNTDPPAHSLQLEARLFGTYSGFVYVSDPRTSHLPVGEVPSVNDPVDALHATYLRYQDLVTIPPHLLSPQPGGFLTRNSVIRFDLPESATPGTLTLSFLATDESETLRVVYLHDTYADTARQVRLDAGDLRASSDVDSVSGPPFLTHQGAYSLVLSYSDSIRNPPATDTLTGLRVDIVAEAAILTEPSHDSESPDQYIAVIYQIFEFPDSLRMIFTVDSLSPVPDTLSPHILTLVSDEYGVGTHVFNLDGTHIGSGGPYVRESNRGQNDSLKWGAVYTVTLSAGDTLGNPPTSVSNSGYNFPRDILTSRPILIDPQPFARENQSIFVQIYLPEEAYPGSVQLTFRRIIGSDPGSPHVLTFPTLTAAGTTGFFLVATAFSTSDLHPVVSGPGTPEQNNTLVNGRRYRIWLSYQDAHGNPASSDSLDNGYIIFDIGTEPPNLLAPQSGDTLSLEGTPVTIMLSERPLPGSLRLTLTQIGGPEVDPLSPHILFLDDSLGTYTNTMILQPGSLWQGSSHVDSVRNNGPLIARGHYRMTLEYQDSLGNLPSSVSVDDVYMPSGSAVFVHGRGYSPQQVQPGAGNILVFQLGLRATGATSLLRALRFFNDGDLTPSDVVAIQCYVWSSADSIFDPNLDVIAGTLSDWPGNYVRLANLGVPLTTSEVYVFVTLTYAEGADPSHAVNLYLDGPLGVDCGGDPVFSPTWPIGEPDIALYVNLLSFTAEQDTSFGALRLRWSVGSEVNNEGFNVLRRLDSDSVFTMIASFTSTPSLTGRGTAPSGWSYSYVDRGLTPGHAYHYRLQAVTSENYVAELLELEASGTPRMPPNDFILSDAYPNPFNQDVTIEYVVPYSSDVSIILYDVMGREIRTLVRNLLAPSVYHARWDSRDDHGTLVPSGLYFYRFRADNGRFEKTKKLMLIR